MDTQVILELNYEFDMLVRTWHEAILHHIANEFDNSVNEDYRNGLEYAYDFIKDLPYNTEYSVNNEVMQKL